MSSGLDTIFISACQRWTASKNDIIIPLKRMRTYLLEVSIAWAWKCDFRVGNLEKPSDIEKSGKIVKKSIFGSDFVRSGVFVRFSDFGCGTVKMPNLGFGSSFGNFGVRWRNLTWNLKFSQNKRILHFDDIRQCESHSHSLSYRKRSQVCAR